MELEETLEISEEGLIRFMSLISGFSNKHQQLFLALYVAFGDELLFIFHLLRGQRIQFPHSRIFSKAAKAGVFKDRVKIEGTGDMVGIDGQPLVSELIENDNKKIVLKRDIQGERYKVVDSSEEKAIFSDKGDQLAFTLLTKGRRVMYDNKFWIVKVPPVLVSKTRFVLLKECVL